LISPASAGNGAVKAAVNVNVHRACGVGAACEKNFFFIEVFNIYFFNGRRVRWRRSVVAHRYIYFDGVYGVLVQGFYNNFICSVSGRAAVGQAVPDNAVFSAGEYFVRHQGVDECFA